MRRSREGRRELTRILLVDDEDDIRTIARMALESIGGMTVEACGSGKHALACFEGFMPDLIVLDVMMPEMDGPALFRRLRAHPAGKDIPILFLTAKTQPEDVGRLRALGALEVIPKPFDPMTLADEIRRIWEMEFGR